MFGRSVRLGRLAGIPIGIQPLWVVIVALITWSLGAAYYPSEVGGISPVASYSLGLLSALLLFASILLHELGHAIAARRRGVEIDEIDLWLLGGVSRMAGYPESARDELLFALAGPVVTLAIVIVCGAVAVALPPSAPAPLSAVVKYQLFVNATILVFNLIPAFPLDGGRVTRSLLWARSGDMMRATRIAASVGRGLGFGMIALGAFAVLGGYLGGLWLALIGFFVTAAARAEEGGLEVRTALGGRCAGRLAAMPAITLPTEATVAAAIETGFAPHGFVAFPVLEDGRPVGLVDEGMVRSVPASRRGRTTVGEIANRDPSLIIGERDDVAAVFARPQFQRLGRAVVVSDDGEAGILSITDVARLLRALELGGAIPAKPSSA